jgi:hypothetical protein
MKLLNINKSTILCTIAACLCLVALGGSPLYAEVFNGDNSTTTFSDPLNWENDVIPGTAGGEQIRIGQVGVGADTVAFQNPAVVDLNDGFSVANPTGDLRVGQGDGGDGTLNQSNGNITTVSGAWSFLGVDAGAADPSIGRYNMSGTASFNSDSPLYLGLGGGSHAGMTPNQGFLTMADSATMDLLGGNGALNVGGNDDNYGQLDQTGGAITVANWVNIGDDSGAMGVYNMSGGTLTAGEYSVGQKNGTDGTLNLSGTASTIVSGGFRVGREDGGTGLLTIDGSGVTLGVDQFAVGSNDATLSTAQGTLDFTADVLGVSAISVVNDVTLNDGSVAGSASLLVDMSLAPAGDILLIDVGGVLNGTFAGLPQGASVPNSGGRFIDYTFGDGNNIGLIVPEPSTLMLCLVGLGVGLIRRKQVIS